MSAEAASSASTSKPFKSPLRPVISTRKSVRFFGVHGRFLELGGHHLAQAFETANLQLAATVEHGGLQFGQMGVVAGICRLAALAQAIERRHGEEQMPGTDEFRHLPIEESDKQRSDMGAIRRPRRS